MTAFLPGFRRCRGAIGLNGVALGQHSRDQFAQRLCVPKTLIYVERSRCPENSGQITGHTAPCTGAAPQKPLPEPVDLGQYRVRKQARGGGLINEYRLAARHG